MAGFVHNNKEAITQENLSSHMQKECSPLIANIVIIWSCSASQIFSPGNFANKILN